ncbi:hypothetical protein OIE13_06120 [Streptosporangium sp. NBC_01810]|uniref:hypothetical protein n=1 Tax=Streptosporangium sp. NBC_01810 TaxID=2975951 RepID=UPI002DD9C23D|nr:hypothetical protein [Streptosporangium sp. NBC_01810]WSA27450.1 hypothetical protein OIE13_06120 [Streptosporangium sp. NBC_01810]
MCEHPGDTRLVMGTRSPDGSVHTRAWTICTHSAEGLAEQLGPPDAETLANAKAVADVGRTMLDTPGLIRTERSS